MVITRVLPDPVVVSSGPAACTKDGAYAWSARFRVGQLQSDLSWIIQKVEINAPSGNHTLYEAFPVSGGEAESLNEDSYQANEKRSSGNVVVKGLAQHFYFGVG
ncbi:MAG: hypothetical protein M0Z30_18275 [Actinomycetota bacterium]|nr:hypothetical protein [Actinomycetota bacterium]